MKSGKRSNLISFKLSEDVLDQLVALQREDESVSLVAKRLVEESVGKAEPRTTVDDVNIKLDDVEDKLNNVLKLLQGKEPAQTA